MIRDTYICLLLIILASYSSFATEDSSTRDVKRLEPSGSVRDENRKHRGDRSLHDEYYEDSESVNYENEYYYPNRPYLYESIEEESSGKDEIGTPQRKQRMLKRRGSKEKYCNGNEPSLKNTHNINSLKSRIKSQKRSKTNMKAVKFRRSADMEEVPLEDKDDSINDYTETLSASLDQDKMVNSAADTSDSNIIKTLGKDQNDKDTVRIKDEDYQPSFIYNKDSDENLQNDLDINNNELNDNNDNNFNKREIHSFSPEEFNLKSLNEALDEEKSNLKQAEFPTHRINGYDSNVQDLGEYIKQDELNQATNQRDIIRNVYNELLSNNYLKQDSQSAQRNTGEEENAKSGDMRTKREQKLKTITLTFPVVDNIESLITASKQAANTTNMQKEVQEIEVKKKIEESQALVTGKCTGAASTTSVPDAQSVAPVTEVQSVSPELGQQSLVTTQPTDSFKELNEANKLIKDVSNYVNGLVSAYSVLDNKQLKDSLIMTNAKGAIIPISLRKIIKVKPHSSELKRSNELSDDMQDIYVVELLKDPKEIASALPIESPKMIFGIPYNSQANKENDDKITNKE